jgi:CheY-like chemotaxis protein
MSGPASNMDASVPSEVSAGDRRIMVVDDDDTIVQMLKATLEAEGFQVRTDRDGRNLLKKATEFLPHMIVADLMMPGGGGYELLRILQSDERTRKTPVLIITGVTLDKSTKALMAQEPNMVGYMEKPIRSQALIKQVHKTLNTISAFEQRRRAEEQAGPPPSSLGDRFI